jgi:hypothetical protein
LLQLDPPHFTTRKVPDHLQEWAGRIDGSVRGRLSSSGRPG